MKITFLLLIIPAVFAINATGNAVVIPNETVIKNGRFIHCKYCPNRESPAISKWLELQSVANQAAGFSNAFFGFLFMVIS